MKKMILFKQYLSKIIDELDVTVAYLGIFFALIFITIVMLFMNLLIFAVVPFLTLFACIILWWMSLEKQLNMHG